jgi:DNA topoisomerase III
VTSVSGHLLGKDFSGNYRKWQGCNPDQLFDAPIERTCDERNTKIKRTLEREARTCDREGENIGFQVIEVCTAVNNRLQIYRAKFSDMTAASLTRAMNNLIAPDERVSQAVDVRSELDLRIGAAFTRFQTLRLQRLFPNQIEDLVSYGSCQLPTLGFVVDRYREIESFIANEFWKIKLLHRMNSIAVDFNWSRVRMFDKNCCEALLKVCKADGQFEIESVEQKSKNKWRPQPMDTVELEKSGSRKLRLTAKAVMTIAEKLYMQGFISYPRTETNQFSKDMNLVPLVQMQTAHRDWGEFATRVLEWGPNPRNGTKSDQAHPPIHPTKFTDSLVGDEKRVYELITRHFLACVSRDAVGSETLVNATIGNEDFHATGLIILERNYLDVFVYDKWSGKEIHNYQVGDRFVPTMLEMDKGRTSPPGLLTEADLITLMEKHGIGTDATHADHIATIKERSYIGDVDGKLVPGKLGMALVEGYELMNLTLSKPQLRAGLEVDLKGISDGTKNQADVLRQQIEIYQGCFRTITQNATTLDHAMAHRFEEQPQVVENAPLEVSITVLHDLFKCPKCQKNSMTIKLKRDNSGSFISCLGYPNCKNAIWLDEHLKELSSLDDKCGNCGGINNKIRMKFKRTSMLGLVNENPAFSYIEEYYYVTCLVCDSKLRELLNISHDLVKPMGNIVGAASNATHSSSWTGGSYQNRNFGTNPAPNQRPNQPPPQNRRPNWFDDKNDDPRPGGGGGAVQTGTSNSNQNNNWSSGQLPVTIKCQCNKLGIRLICRKDGPNQNRAFIKCAKSSCNFFQWEDANVNNGNNNNNYGNNFGNNSNNFRNNNNNNNNSTGAQRRCSVCRQTGHNKKSCPSNRN